MVQAAAGAASAVTVDAGPRARPSSATAAAAPSAATTIATAKADW
jgi:hypothetical protein